MNINHSALVKRCVIYNLLIQSILEIENSANERAEQPRIALLF
jgi:hypothetical protein